MIKFKYSDKLEQFGHNYYKLTIFDEKDNTLITVVPIIIDTLKDNEEYRNSIALNLINQNTSNIQLDTDELNTEFS